MFSSSCRWCSPRRAREASCGPANRGRKVNIDRSYEARDACLARNAAADGTSREDPATLAHAAALSCSAETDKLIVASNLSSDAKVAASIRQDSEFRAMKYVMQARG